MRTIFFFDGFNLYHEMDKRKAWHKYKWLDMRKLANRIVRKGHEVRQVLYFSAYCTWDNFKEDRHRKYIQALNKHGVQTILGKFIPITQKYKRDVNEITYILPTEIQFEQIPEFIEYRTYVEKRTDVNIATTIMDLGYKNIFDCAYIVTGDGDIAPAIEALKKKFPEKRFVAVLPFKSKSKARDIVDACDEIIELTEEDIEICQLPDIVKIDTSLSVSRPPTWR